MARKADLRKISKFEIYSIAEAAKELNLNPLTIRQWIKKGLPIIKGIQPIQIDGADLKLYISNMRKPKIKLAQNEFKCMKCKKAVSVKPEQIEIVETDKLLNSYGVKQVILKTKCPKCNQFLCKFSSSKQIMNKKITEEPNTILVPNSPLKTIQNYAKKGIKNVK